jgi:hypothetical protein
MLVGVMLVTDVALRPCVHGIRCTLISTRSRSVLVVPHIRLHEGRERSRIYRIDIREKRARVKTALRVVGVQD